MRRQVRPVAGDVLQDATALYSDTRTALGAAGIDYTSAASGFHADSKAVGFFTAGNRRLVGAFHNNSRLNDLYKEKYSRRPAGAWQAQLSIVLFFLLPVKMLCLFASSPAKTFKNGMVRGRPPAQP